MPVMGGLIDGYELALVGTSAVAAVSCTLPGVWLVLRRHSMMGDALSHSALLGTVGAVLTVNMLAAGGWIAPGGLDRAEDVALLVGAVGVGVLTAYLTEALERLGRVESGAALGVVFSSLFALGLFLIRWKADTAHIDADCVLFGNVELAAAEAGPWGLPRPLWLNGLVLAANAAMTAAAYKELRLASFDADFAATQGLRPRLVHYGLMTATALTVVAAFTTVGSILVVGLLVVPAATGLLLSRSLGGVLRRAVVVAVVAAVLSRLVCRTVPAWVFGGWGVEDSSTAGVMAVCAGGMFTAAWLFSPRGGLLTRRLAQARLSAEADAEDLLRTLYRFEERGERATTAAAAEHLLRSAAVRRLAGWNAARRLGRQGLVSLEGDELRLTRPGRARAEDLIRGHRLVETFYQRNFALPDDHLHEAARRVDPFVDAALRRQLSEELDGPGEDPHGRAIP